MPVPGHGLEGKVLVPREVSLQDPEEDRRQHDCAKRDVQSVEARQHEERRTVDARRQPQVQVLVGMDVFVGLQADEDEAQDERGAEEGGELRALAGDQRVVRDRYRHRRGQQDGRIDQWQAHRTHR